MPELPEVETIVRELRPSLVGRTIAGVWTSGLPLRLARPIDERGLRRVCAGAQVAAVRRRGKYILVDLVGTTPGGVLVHLGMSGRLRFQPASDPRDKHTHVVWRLSGDRELRFVDPRRFGNVRVAREVDGLPELASLGPDPLTDLQADRLSETLAASRAPLKAFLLDQKRIAGLGNIYVSEALFRAGLHPTLAAHKAKGKAEVLVRAIRDTLTLGIANRGTTLRDYVGADGGAGDNFSALLVYGREGEACSRCSAAIRRRVDAGRSTFFCATCQRR